LGWAPLVVAVGCLLLAIPSQARADELYRTAKELIDKNAAEIEALADWCQQHQLGEQARKTRELLGKRDPYKLYLPVLPKTVGPTPLPADAPADVVEWDQRLGKLRRDQANALFDLSRRAVRAGRLSLAYDLVVAAIRTNPDLEPVRRLMGYQDYGGQWHTAYEVGKLRTGQVWHKDYGWLPESRVRRYEQGQRYVRGRWLSSEKDTELHRNIQSGWVVETEHYSITTDHSLEAGVQLGEKLEELFGVWQKLFVRFYASPAHVQALFDGRVRKLRTQMPRFDVSFFRDRQDYNRSLRAVMPSVDITIGVYIERTGRAYFFAGEGYEDRTLFHEATHQLFHQSRGIGGVAPDVGREANFWIVEGIALYMESLRREGDYYTLGGFDDERMYAARVRLLRDNFYVPLAELTTYGMEKLQTDERIATLYSQCAGLTNFLIHYDGGRYRDALVAYLVAVYTGRDTPETLSQLTGTTYAELDKQYRKFIKSVPEPATNDTPSQ
jgi:hypothetical protein